MGGPKFCISLKSPNSLGQPIARTFVDEKFCKRKGSESGRRRIGTQTVGKREGDYAKKT